MVLRKAVPRHRKKILVLEGPPFAREGLVVQINRRKDLRVCGRLDDVEQLSTQVARLKPHVVVLNTNRVGKTGIEQIKLVRTTHPEIKFLILSSQAQPYCADRLLKAGADGYVIYEEGSTEVIDAIRDVLAGKLYLSEEVFLKRPQSAEPL